LAGIGGKGVTDRAAETAEAAVGSVATRGLLGEGNLGAIASSYAGGADTAAASSNHKVVIVEPVVRGLVLHLGAG